MCVQVRCKILRGAFEDWRELGLLRGGEAEFAGKGFQIPALGKVSALFLEDYRKHPVHHHRQTIAGCQSRDDAAENGENQQSAMRTEVAEIRAKAAHGSRVKREGGLIAKPRKDGSAEFCFGSSAPKHQSFAERTSSASRRPSPRKLREKSVSENAVPGNTRSHQNSSI